jgi:ribosome-binding protein aMBF1 (putative translation factor)
LLQNVIPEQPYKNIPEKNNTTVSNFNRIVKRHREDTQHITQEVKVKLNKIAYYLSKFEHYSLFERDLNQGETLKKLADILAVKVTTLKNKRDLYDPYCSTRRVGWVQQAKLSDDMQDIYNEYKEKTSKEILEEIMKFINN